MGLARSTSVATGGSMDFYHYILFVEKCINCSLTVRQECKRINAKVSHLVAKDTFSEYGKCKHCGYDSTEGE